MTPSGLIISARSTMKYKVTCSNIEANAFAVAEKWNFAPGGCETALAEMYDIPEHHSHGL